MKTDKLTVLLILDAFRWDYVNAEDTPTICQLAQDGAYGAKVRSSPGFTQRSSVLTGTWPETTGNFTMFIYDPSRSQYRYLRFFPFLKWFEFRLRKVDNLIRIILAKINRKFFRGRFFPPAYIPFEMLPLIGISEDHIPIYEPGSFGDVESLFDVFHRENVETEFIMHPLAEGDDQWVQKKLLETTLSSGVIFAQFSDSDLGIHKAGVGSDGARDIIRDIDRRIAALKAEYDSRDQEYELILIGDHGMENVDTELDLYTHVRKHLKAQGLRFCKDYVLFLSSTLAHFWWRNKKAEAAIKALVQDEVFSRHGFVLTEDVCKELQIPKFEAEHGNLVWAANEGVLLFPDYFHRYRSYRAMHGYIGHCDAMKGFAVAYNNRTSYKRHSDLVNLVDICPTIAVSAGVPVPAHNVGVPLQHD